MPRLVPSVDGGGVDASDRRRTSRDRGRPGRMVLHRLILPVLAVLAVLPIAGARPANAAELLPYQKISEKNMVDVAFDSSGNLYESEDNGNVNVWPLAAGTVFGHPVTVGKANTLFTLHDTPAIAFDSAGDLFVTDRDGSTGGGIYVLPVASGTIFGVTVKADKPSEVLSGIDDPIGLGFDSAGNLYYATQNTVDVLPAASGMLYGHLVIVDTPSVLVSGLTEGGFIAFDTGPQSQDLFYTDVGNQASGAASVNVLPGSSTTIYGQPVTAGTPAVLFGGLTDASGVTIDPAGDLYVDTYGNLDVVSPTSETIDGTNVTANMLSQLATGLVADLGNTVSNGDVFVVDQGNKSIDELATPTAGIAYVTFGGSASNPLIMVQGTGFTTPPSSKVCKSATGKDYKYGDLYLVDNTNAWYAGLPGDCIGLTVAELKSGTAEFGLGSFYVRGGDALAPGDSYTLGVDGTTLHGTVTYSLPSLAAITSVKPGSGSASGGTSVTIKGTGLTGTKWVFFGSIPAKHVKVANGSITCTTPPGTGVVSVTAVNAFDQVSATDGIFTYGTAITPPN
jgi:IPT/TIG domain